MVDMYIGLPPKQYKVPYNMRKKDIQKKQDIRCPNGHKVAEKKGNKIEIKCKSCKCKVEV